MKMEDMVLASIDDHLIEPPDMFDQHLSKEHRKLAPEYVVDDNGDGFWYWEHEQKKTFSVGLNAVVGRPREEYGFEPTSISQMRKGTWDRKAHIDDLNVAGIYLSLNFPTMANFDGSFFWDAKDKPSAIRVIQAYNDWHIDEWCGYAPERYIPTAILPIWDPKACVDEIKRVIKKGCRSVTFPSNPSIKGFLDIHNEQWDPLYGLCNEENVVLNCHIGTGQAPTYASANSSIAAWIHTLPMAIAADTADWLHNEALTKYPNLKIAVSEGGIGWVPYFLERADFVFEHHGPWTRTDKIFGKKKPSEVFREHFMVCFIDDKFGMQNIDAVGEDIIAYEMDYPHSDCTWPNVPEELWKSVNILTDEQIDKVTHKNVFRWFDRDPIAEFGRENCTVAALRKRAANVDLTPESYGGLDARGFGDPNKPVTAADVWETQRDHHGAEAAE